MDAQAEIFRRKLERQLEKRVEENKTHAASSVEAYKAKQGGRLIQRVLDTLEKEQ